jgi:hypothetical protein
MLRRRCNGLEVAREILGDGAVGIGPFDRILPGPIVLDVIIVGIDEGPLPTGVGRKITAHHPTELRQAAGEALGAEDLVDAGLPTHLGRDPANLADVRAEGAEHPGEPLGTDDDDRDQEDQQDLRERDAEHARNLNRAAGFVHKPARKQR